MSGRGWREIWEARALDPTRGSTLAQLMAADGLDTGFGNVSEDAWSRFALGVAAALGAGPGDSLYDVGCGAGAFVYPLAGAGLKVGGLDASRTLLGYGAAALPGGTFDHAEAAALDPGAPWDFVVSCGVFLYFPSLDYAADVITRMARKARRGVAVLDVNDAARRDAALALRRGALGEAEYAARYRGLDHLFIERAWLEARLREAGLVDVRIADQSIEGYANAAYRFNAFARKPGAGLSSG